jgi:hypothetical protein
MPRVREYGGQACYGLRIADSASTSREQSHGLTGALDGRRVPRSRWGFVCRGEYKVRRRIRRRVEVIRIGPGAPQAVTFRPDPKPARSNGGMGRRKRRQALAVTAAAVKARIRAKSKCQVCRLCGRGVLPRAADQRRPSCPPRDGRHDRRRMGRAQHHGTVWARQRRRLPRPDRQLRPRGVRTRLRLLLTDDEVGYVIAQEGARVGSTAGSRCKAAA